MLEVGLFFLMLVIILGFLWLIAWWNGVVERRAMSSNQRVRSVPLPSTEPQYAFWCREINPETAETAETPRRIAETELEKIQFAETAVADALARLILADELDKTKAIKIGAGKKSGEGYQKWARLVAASMDRQKQPQFLDETGERVAATYPVSGRRG